MENAIEFFPNLNALLAANASRKLNRAFKDCPLSLSSNRESAKQTEFTGTANYADAERLCREGWFENLEDFKLACSITTTQPRRRVVTAPTGYAPHVPNAIMGRPDSMMKTIMLKEKTKAVNVVVNTTINGNYSASCIRKYAAEIVKAISAIEAAGTRVSLTLCAVSVVAANNGQLAQCFITLKQAGEKINPTRIYFPLVHPSMLRRIGFKWLETCPAVTSKRFQVRYGYPERLNKLNLPQPLHSAKFINLKDVVVGNWDAKEILARLK